MSNEIKNELLNGCKEYERLGASLQNGEGALSVFGLGEAHRVHMAAALFRSLGKTMLFVAPSSLSAAKTHEELSFYVPDAKLFPPRELPVAVQHFTESPAVKAQRLDVITRLISCEPTLVVTCVEALMQRMAPAELIVNAMHSVRIGDRRSEERL